MPQSPGMIIPLLGPFNSLYGRMRGSARACVYFNVPTAKRGTWPRGEAQIMVFTRYYVYTNPSL